MDLDFLISKAGLRIAKVDVQVEGLTMVRGRDGLVPERAATVEGKMHLEMADLTAALARPELLDQLLAGVSGMARPEITVANGDEGGIRLIGSVEVFGRRFPVTASTRLRIEGDKIIVSPSQVDGLPLMGLLTGRLPELALPLELPAGLRFTDVTTEPGAIVVSFSGTDISMHQSEPPARI